MDTNTRYETQRIDHLGLVAGISREIGLVEYIDAQVGPSGRKVSCGQSVLALLLNALGFSGRALYLVPDYLRHKPVDLLISPDLTADDFNDDTLGRSLDALYAHGLTELFAGIASQALQHYGIEHQFVPVDSTSFHLHGQYPEAPAAPPPATDAAAPSPPAAEPAPTLITITQGYSRDQRPDLKQVVAQLITSQQSNLPVWLEVLSGNSSDKTSFVASVKAYCEHLGDAAKPYFVMDSAGYSATNLQTYHAQALRWVMRVPETLTEAQQVVQDTSKADMTELAPGYGGKLHPSDYGGVAQRWLVVFSPAAYEREQHTLDQACQREQATAEAQWRQLSRRVFQCAADAATAGPQFNQRWHYHQVSPQVTPVTRHTHAGRPAATAQPDIVGYTLTGTITVIATAVTAAQPRLGKFIIATNELDSAQLSLTALLENYKAQSVSVERGFRFLKDPLFFAQSLFLKSPARLMALILVMGLALLIFALGERQLRQALIQHQETVPNQKGQPTATPTLRWVFQLFEGLDVLSVWVADQLSGRQILHLRPVHQQILRLLGPQVQKCYLAAP